MANWQALEETWIQSSYPTPVPAPNAEPGAAPTVCVQFAGAWLPYVLGALFQLTQPSAWLAGSPGYAAAQAQAQGLMAIFGEAGVCTDMLQFQFTDTCGLQYSVDGGVTWIDVPGWSTFAPGCFAGPTGPTGPAGESPQLRWSGCTFQVSNDGGATWTDLSGFDIPTLQGCLGGTPTTPPGTTLLEMACNIASWLAIQILQGSLASLATSIGAGATALEAALGLFDLAASWSGIGTIVFEAAGIFVAAGTAIGESALNTAASDATLRGDLTCAIFEAIKADGSVTTGNFALVLANIGAISYATPGIVGLIHDYVSNLGYAGIAAIQAEGSLYDGDCSACAWCYTFDFTAGAGLWVQDAAASPFGVYVPGQGWTGQPQTGDRQLVDIRLDAGALPGAPASFSFTSGEMDGTTSAGGGAFASYWSDTSVGSGPITATFTAANTGGAVANLHSGSASDAPFSSIRLRLITSGVAGAPPVITRITLRGVGTNPFGADNCT